MCDIFEVRNCIRNTQADGALLAALSMQVQELISSVETRVSGNWTCRNYVFFLTLFFLCFFAISFYVFSY